MDFRIGELATTESHCAATEEEDGDEEPQPVGEARSVVGPQTDVPVAPVAVDKVQEPTHHLADESERENQTVPKAAPEAVFSAAVGRSALCKPHKQNQAKPENQKPLNVKLFHNWRNF